MSSEYNFSQLSDAFQAIIGKKELNLQIYDMLPIPIEVFASDGTSIYVNRAAMEMTGCKDASLLIGKYNLKNDPVCLEIIGQEIMDRIFLGEAVSFPDFPAPIQDVLDRGVIDEKPWEAATMDLFMLPIWDGNIFVCTICFFTVKNMYKGRADIARSQEYMRQHWLDEFDMDTAARAANLSRRHFQRIFKEVTSITPLEYYKHIKMEKLKENLLDSSLSISEAFTACGVDYNGNYKKVFKDAVGKTPSEYRKDKLKMK